MPSGVVQVCCIRVGLSVTVGARSRTEGEGLSCLDGSLVDSRGKAILFLGPVVGWETETRMYV